MAQHSIHNFMVFSFVFAAVGELGNAWEIGKSVVASVPKFAYFPPARSLSQSVSQAVHNNSTLDWRGVTHNEPMLSVRHARPHHTTLPLDMFLPASAVANN